VPKWLDTLGQSIELFWIWTLILIAIGFASANPKKSSLVRRRIVFWVVGHLGALQGGLAAL